VLRVLVRKPMPEGYSVRVPVPSLNPGAEAVKEAVMAALPLKFCPWM
jgi:hypothetical protein